MKVKGAVVMVILQIIMISSCRGQLSTDDPYITSCPTALSTIQSAVNLAILNDTRVAAQLLRLHFHDCFVNGCDASILLDDTASFTGEKTATPNLNSLRGFDVIDSVKAELETLCPQIVSCADILAVAARDSVVAMSGPSWDVELGRRDSTTASLDLANSDLPAVTLDVADLITVFSNKGLSTQDLVALSGAHTIGQARCTSFRSRIYNETSIDATLASSLQSICPSDGSDDNALSPIDATSVDSFDTAYFDNLVSNYGLMHSDQQLFIGDGSTDSFVIVYAADPATFFTDFATAMIKMGGITPLTGSDGEIRTNCRNIN